MNEDKFIQLCRWVWRNLLASGVFITCFVFIYLKCEQIEDRLIEVSTVLKERIRIERGDYGWLAAAPAYDDEPSEQTIEEGKKIRKHIDSFADKK